MSQFFTWGAQSTGVSALASFLPKKSQGWSPSEWTGWISLMLGGIGGRRRRGRKEDEMAGWHHWLDGREFQGTPGVGDGQAGLACWGRKESETTEQLNWTECVFYSIDLSPAFLNSNKYCMFTQLWFRLFRYLVLYMLFTAVCIWENPHQFTCAMHCLSTSLDILFLGGEDLLFNHHNLFWCWIFIFVYFFS